MNRTIDSSHGDIKEDYGTELKDIKLAVDEKDVELAPEKEIQKVKK